MYLRFTLGIITLLKRKSETYDDTSLEVRYFERYASLIVKTLMLNTEIDWAKISIWELVFNTKKNGEAYDFDVICLRQKERISDLKYLGLTWYVNVAENKVSTFQQINNREIYRLKFTI